jgi:hypothetical protein
LEYIDSHNGTLGLIENDIWRTHPSLKILLIELDEIKNYNG